MEIKLITSSDTLPIRQRILRPNQDIQTCLYPNDDSIDTFHVGAFMDGKIVGVATFIKESHPDFSSTHSFRLRGMATDSHVQGKGVGRQVLLFGMALIRQQQGDFLWCNARESAFEFYRKLDLQLHGPSFEIQGIGTHKVMYKYL